MPLTLPRLCLLALPALTLFGAQAADARCSRPEDVQRFARGIAAALRCEQPRRADPGCRVPEPAECAAAARASILELLAPVRRDPISGRVATPSACRQALLRGARRYVVARVRQRLEGRRGAPRERFVERLLRACDEPGLPLPRLGGSCAPLFEAAGGPDVGGFARCAVATLEASIDRALPRPLRPNIVLILTDDQRADSLEFMPHTLEQLADRGIRFDNGFVTTPVCGPSRVSILSGRLASQHRVLTNRDFVDAENDFDEDQTFARWLQSAGYRTAFLGKYVNGAGLRPPGAPQGWDDWQVFRAPRYLDYTLDVNGELEPSAPDEYSTDALAERAADFIDESREEPFLLVLSLFAPHLPAIPAPRHEGIFTSLPPARPPSFQEPDLTGKPSWIRFVASFRQPPEDVDALRIRQLETLPAVDEAVATVLDAIDHAGVTDNTAVVFTSDNGYHWGEHWWTSKFTGYEESLRVPYVVRYPVAAPVPRRSDAIVLNIDLAPSFAALAGAIPAVDVDGESFVPLLEEGAAGREAFPFESFDRFVVRPMSGTRDDRYKLIVTEPTAAPFEELYDLAVDPFELANRAGDPDLSEVLERLRERVDEILP